MSIVHTKGSLLLMYIYLYYTYIIFLKSVRFGNCRAQQLATPEIRGK